RAEVRVRRLEPRREGRAVERGSELEQVVVALGDRPEEEVGLGSDARHRVGPQALHATRELVDDLRERVLAGGPLVDREPSPRRVEAKEPVADVLAHTGALDPFVLALAHGASNGTHGRPHAMRQDARVTKTQYFTA